MLERIVKWAHALKIYIILFSGARVVIAHKQKSMLSLNKSIYKYLNVKNVESYGTKYSFKIYYCNFMKSIECCEVIS